MPDPKSKNQIHNLQQCRGFAQVWLIVKGPVSLARMETQYLVLKCGKVPVKPKALFPKHLSTYMYDMCQKITAFGRV